MLHEDGGGRRWTLRLQRIGRYSCGASLALKVDSWRSRGNARCEVLASANMFLFWMT